MEFHIHELQRLMTLTTDRRTLSWLSEGVSRARKDLCQAKANRKARRQLRRRLARQQRRAIQVRMPRVGLRNIDTLRTDTIAYQDMSRGIGAQDTMEGYLERYWRLQPQINKVSSV